MALAREDNVKSILSETKLDFQIEKLPLSGIKMVGDDLHEIKSSYFGLMNSKSQEIIHTVKKGYRVSQNDEVVRLALEGCSQFPQLSVQKGGPIHGGRRVFLQLALNEEAIVGEDTIKRYVTILDSNDGTAKLSIGIGNITASCTNQFWKFFKERSFSIGHNEELEKKMLELPMMIEQALAKERRLIEIYNKFESTAITKDLANLLVHQLVGIDKVSNLDLTEEEMKKVSAYKINQMNSLYEHITKEMNHKGVNLWGLHSGTTSWTTHSKSVPKRTNGRVESLMIGSNYRTNEASLNFAMNHAELVW